LKYFLDCEFNERGYEHRIELISIALVREDGEEYYAVARDGWDPCHCDGWLMANVLPYLSKDGRVDDVSDLIVQMYYGMKVDPRIPWASRTWIRNGILDFIAPDEHPEFIGFFSDYDWVLFSQLFGRMVDLPPHFPKYCLDIKQMMVAKGLQKSDLPKQEETQHNALADARHMRRMYQAIVEKASITISTKADGLSLIIANRDINSPDLPDQDHSR